MSPKKKQRTGCAPASSSANASQANNAAINLSYIAEFGTMMTRIFASPRFSEIRSEQPLKIGHGGFTAAFQKQLYTSNQMQHACMFPTCIYVCSRKYTCTSTSKAWA